MPLYPPIVTSIAGNEGAFTLSNGIGNSTNDIRLNLVSAFSVNNNSVNETGIADATATQITWSTELYDVGSNFASNAWTPPAGKVQMMVAMLTSGTITLGALFSIKIYKNGSQYKSVTLPSATNQGAGVLALEDIANGTDAYTTYLYQDVVSGTVTLNGDPVFSWWAGHWIGP